LNIILPAKLGHLLAASIFSERENLCRVMAQDSRGRIPFTSPNQHHQNSKVLTEQKFVVLNPAQTKKPISRKHQNTVVKDGMN